MSRPLVSVLAFSLLLLRPHSGAATDSELRRFFERTEDPAVGAELVPPGTFVVGSATLRPSGATRAFELLAGELRIGLLLEGETALEYAIEDRFSLQIASRNFDAASGIRLEPGRTNSVARAKLEGAAIFGIGLELPERMSATSTPMALPDWLRKHLRERLSSNPTRDLALEQWNGATGFRWALLHGRGDELVLDVDPKPAIALESLSRIEKQSAPPSLGSTGFGARDLMAQPIGRPWWQPPTIDLTAVEVDLTLTNPAGETAEIRARSTFETHRDGMRLVALSHPSWSRDEAHGWHPFEIRRVLVDGQEVPYLHRAGSLLVELPAASRSGGRFVLDTESRAELLDRPDGNNYWTLAGSWYPTPTSNGSTWASYRIVVDTPAPFEPRVGGREIRRTRANGRIRVESRLDGPASHPAVVAGKYRTTTFEESGRRVHLSTYAESPDDYAAKIANSVLAIQGCYSNWFGVPYPFPDLELVEIKSWGWGMAPPGTIFITREAFLSYAEKRAATGVRKRSIEQAKGLDLRLAHEVAHGWFPHVVRVLDPEEGWLSESFSDYLSAVCLQHAHPNRTRGDERFRVALNEWKDFSRQLKPGASIFLTPHLSSEPENGNTRRLLLYGKGPLVLHALRQELARRSGDEEAGDRQFIAWIRAVVQTFAQQHTTTRGIVDVLNEQTGADWWPWFERYVLGTETPPLG